MKEETIIEGLAKLHPAVAVALIIGVAAIACTFIYQIFKGFK